jgi:hypothetical protein
LLVSISRGVLNVFCVNQNFCHFASSSVHGYPPPSLRVVDDASSDAEVTAPRLRDDDDVDDAIRIVDSIIVRRFALDAAIDVADAIGDTIIARDAPGRCAPPPPRPPPVRRNTDLEHARIVVIDAMFAAAAAAAVVVVVVARVMNGRASTRDVRVSMSATTPL